MTKLHHPVGTGTALELRVLEASGPVLWAGGGAGSTSPVDKASRTPTRHNLSSRRPLSQRDRNLGFLKCSLSPDGRQK